MDSNICTTRIHSNRQAESHDKEEVAGSRQCFFTDMRQGGAKYPSDHQQVAGAACRFSDGQPVEARPVMYVDMPITLRTQTSAPRAVELDAWSELSTVASVCALIFGIWQCCVPPWHPGCVLQPAFASPALPGSLVNIAKRTLCAPHRFVILFQRESMLGSFVMVALPPDSLCSMLPRAYVEI
eukprot:TRINITY_DN18752_c0_g1_i1.p2 TRINITY_DN18752_c0_g1~~TRINITY_DN18752_c0_g1_i1.p2  ORF type:complete len:183 (+),score=3.69 TRINITY_DN18752_c0_g1_i1:1-549(+)